MNLEKKKILIAPLNWGLGHATRCIPIIKALEENGFEPIIASDGEALLLLKKEFPKLKFLELLTYNISYSKKRKFFIWKILKQIPKIILNTYKERELIDKWVAEFNISGIISDNRPGVISKKAPSVYITHQLNILSGFTSKVSTLLHWFTIRKYNECWVPDFEKEGNLSGKLGHLKKPYKNIKYIGSLSRLEKIDLPIKYDLMVILSGPEPQRALLEDILFKELSSYKGTVLFVKGKIENEQTISTTNNFHVFNFMTTSQIEKGYNESGIVLCRSGYTTVMDLAKLEKKVFFIPTPGQLEQEYLSEKFEKEGVAPSCKQENFKIGKLDKIDSYKGFKNYHSETNWGNIFKLFK